MTVLHMYISIHIAASVLLILRLAMHIEKSIFFKPIADYLWSIQEWINP